MNKAGTALDGTGIATHLYPGVFLPAFGAISNDPETRARVSGQNGSILGRPRVECVNHTDQQATLAQYDFSGGIGLWM